MCLIGIVGLIFAPMNVQDPLSNPRTNPASAKRIDPAWATQAGPSNPPCLILARSRHLSVATVSNAAANLRPWVPEPVALGPGGTRGGGRSVRRGDAVLLRDVANGDPNALGELYDRYARAV